MQVFEQKIIGGIVGGTVAPGSLNLDASDFEDSDLGSCFSAAQQLETEKVKIDAEILYLRMIQRNDAGFYSAQDFRLMAQGVNSVSVVYEAVEKVKATALKTFLLEKTAEIALEEKRTGADLLDKLKTLVNEADRLYRTSENNFVFLSDLAAKTIGVYEDFHAKISYAVTTGFTDLDNLLLDGFSKGDEHIIVGFTGTGKSALALNCAKEQAKQGFCVGVVSREMADIENVMRLQSGDAKIPRWQMRSGMFPGTLEKLKEHMVDFSKLPIAFDTRTEHVENLRPQVRQMVEKFDMRILYVDYLQLMTSDLKHSSRANEVQTISRTLKQIAMENKIPVVSLCQFNRSAAQATVFDIMAHLKESSGIEQDASTITYIQIEKTEDVKQIKEAKLTVLKNRNGATFQSVELDYQGEIFTFSEKVRDAYTDRF